MEYRLATAEDVDLLCRLRVQQLADEGQDTSVNLGDGMERFFSEGFAAGNMFVLLAIAGKADGAAEDGEAVATCGALLLSFPPSFAYPSGKWGYLHSVYTHKDWRRRGISSEMVRRVDALLREAGYDRQFLVASDEGRYVYEKAGFASTDQFMKNW